MIYDSGMYNTENLQFTCKFTNCIGTKYTQVLYRAWYQNSIDSIAF